MTDRAEAGVGVRQITPVGVAAWAVALLAWTLGVVVWPRLPVEDSAASLGWQSSLCMTLATIIATLLALVLTVGLVAAQLLSQFSWRSTRTILDLPAGLVLLLVLAIGVGLPLVVGTDPSAARTRWAFAGFGYALLLIAGALWVGMERMTPGWLVRRAVRQGLSAVEGAARGKRRPQTALAVRTDVLGELVAAAELANAERRRALVAIVVVAAARARAGERPDEIASLVQGLALTTEGQKTPSQIEDTVIALAALGIDQAHTPAVHDAIRQALTGIAHRARAGAHHELGHAALDALIDVAVARLRLLVPQQVLPALVRPVQPARQDGFSSNARARFAPRHPEAGRAGDTASAEVVAEAEHARRRVDEGGVAHLPAHTAKPAAAGLPEQPPSGLGAARLGEMANALVVQSHLLTSGILAVLRTLDAEWAVRAASGSDGDAEAAHATRAGDDGYNLLLDTLATLKAVLAAPRPDTSGWPGGWQGSGAFERDVRRIGRLVAGLYEHHQLPPSDAVEETLENVAALLRADPQPRIDRPPDRTGWRIAHDRDERGAEAATAEILGKLMSTAFNAGFDRRALLTGRRLLAAITGAAEPGDLTAVDAYGQALEKATRAMTRHHPDHRLAAHQHRGLLLLAGLIAELAPLFAVGLRNGPGLAERINQIAETLAWSTSGNPYPLAAASWQARLTAAGWPVPPPGPHTLRWDAPNASGPLPAPLVNLAEEELSLHLGVDDPIWPAALLITLWAHAVSSVQAGDLDQPARLHGLLANIIEEHNEAHAGEPAVTDIPVGQDPPPGVRPLDPQLRRLAGAAMRWAEAAEAGRPSAVVPRARGARRLQVVIRKLLATPGFPDWSYHGLRIDDEALVIVEEPDGSRRLLRDPEARARGEFAWGYGGSGLYGLAVTDP